MHDRRAGLAGAAALVAALLTAPTLAQNSVEPEPTVPALPGIPEYTVRAFRTDGFAARALDAEADDPPWSVPMEARLRGLLDEAPAFDPTRVEIECRTTRCGLLVVHGPTAERAQQSELLAYIQNAGVEALGFDGSLSASVGQTGPTRYTVVYFEGFRNIGPPQPLAVWLLAFGFAHDPREQLLVGEEIVQSRSLIARRWLEPWLRAASVYARANAAYVLARYGDPRGIATLEQIVAESSGPGLLGAGETGATSDELDHAAYLLGILGDPGSFETLWRSLEGPLPSGYPSRAVEQALLQTVDASAIPFLLRELENRNVLQRGMAIQVLARLGAVDALPALETMFLDEATPFRGSRTTIGMLARQAQALIRIAALTAVAPAPSGGL